MVSATGLLIKIAAFYISSRFVSPEAFVFMNNVPIC